MELTAKNVESVVLHCLYRQEELSVLADGETPPGAKLASGIVSNFGFHPDRLKEKEADIRAMLKQLPEQFAEGYSFLAACNDRNGRQWGEHRDMDALFCLGTAIGVVTCLMPREMWSVLPGGMPYYQVTA